MVKVVHFITELSVGGAQIALFHLLEGVDRDQYDLRVICLYNGNGRFAEKIRALGIPVYDAGMTSKWRLDAFARLYRYLRQERPFILHTWMFHANIPGRLIGRLAHVPVILSAERTMGQENVVRLRLNRWTSPLTDGVICVSQTVRDYAIKKIGIPAHKITVIPNGIDESNFMHLPSRQEARQTLALPLNVPIVVTVGRPRPVKGYTYLIQAWRHVSATIPQATLIFLGDSPDRAQLEELSIQYNLQHTISFLGEWDNIPHLLPAFDLFVLPSLHEGMSNAALEAMAAGLPIVATAVGGTPELVIHNQTGILVPPADAAALADGLVQLLNAPEKSVQFGAAGKKRVQTQFSQLQSNQLTDALYKTYL